MKSQNKKKVFLTLLGLLLLSGWFYWYQIRPAIIKHNCSWIKMHTDAIPEKVGMTEEQLKENGMIKTCPPQIPYTPGVFISLSDPRSYDGCMDRNRDIINANLPQKYVPAKDWYQAANSQQYSFCLHDKGL